MTKVHELADRAGQAIRAANHATIVPGHLTVQDTCQIVAELAYLTRGLDQLCRQLDRNLHKRIEAEQRRHDAFADPIATTISAAAQLRVAAQQLDAVTMALSSALNKLSHIADTGDLPL